jgi:hypothetical protein
MTRFTLLAAVICLAATACAIKGTTQSETSLEFPPARELRIGVLPFAARNDAVGEAVADEVTVALMAIPNLVFVERTRMLDILRDHNLDPAGDFWFANVSVADAAGVDAFLLGSVSLYESRTEDFSRKSYVAYNARLVDARSGKVLYLLSANGIGPDVPPNIVAQTLATQAVTNLLNPQPAPQ